MADDDALTPLNSDECREPKLEDLVMVCRELNKVGAHYLVVGGFAIRAAGFARNTQDIDLLVETGIANEALVINALMILPDKAIREIKPGEVAEYGVVRVADDILIDLMKSGCGVDYADAIKDAVFHEIDGVRIPFASPMTLWRMKQTVRAKDVPDRLFLRKLLEEKGITVDPEVKETNPLPGWLRRVFGVK
jgi:hypothetical protein